MEHVRGAIPFSVLESIKKDIDNSQAKMIIISELSDKYGISPKDLMNQFKHKYKFTVKQYDVQVKWNYLI